jgi:hypothetical protein
VTASRGLRIGGRVARYNVPLPPPAGPARTEFCIIEGVRALNAGRRKYGQALIGVGAHFPRRLADLPPKYPLHEQHSELWSRRLGRARGRAWFRLRNQIDDLDDAARTLGARHLGRAWAGAESAARSALEAAVAAFNWLDDVAQDLDESISIDVDSFSCATGIRGWGLVTTGALLDQAHNLAHLAGELAGGLFGCRLVHDGEEWTKRCPLSLMHIRLGNSPGMTVRYSCWICGQDPAECDHEPGKAYNVVAAHSNGECNICRFSDSDSCEHIVGQVYHVRAGRSIVEADLHEVSLVLRPRDPLARIESINCEDDRMRGRFGFVPSPDSMLLCHDCMYPCTGFSGRDLPAGDGGSE